MYKTNIAKEQEFILKNRIMNQKEIDQATKWAFEASFIRWYADRRRLHSCTSARPCGSATYYILGNSVRKPRQKHRVIIRTSPEAGDELIPEWSGCGCGHYQI